MSVILQTGIQRFFYPYAFYFYTSVTYLPYRSSLSFGSSRFRRMETTAAMTTGVFANTTVIQEGKPQRMPG